MSECINDEQFKAVTGGWDYAGLPKNIRVGEGCFLERKEFEALIAEKVLKPSKPAGNASHAIRLAIIKFQKTEGLLADGHPSRALLQRLREWSPASSS